MHLVQKDVKTDMQKLYYINKQRRLKGRILLKRNKNKIEENIRECRADMELFDFLLKAVPEWDKYIIERHRKYVRAYLESNRSLSYVSMKFDFTEDDIRSIFWRVQRYLMYAFIELAIQHKIITRKLPTNFDFYLKWYLQLHVDDHDKVFKNIKNRITARVSIDGVGPKRRTKITKVLQTLSEHENELKEKLPENIYNIANDLLNGVPLTVVCKRHNRTLDYLSNSIIGRSNPRKKSERGWVAYLGDNIELSKKKQSNVLVMKKSTK